jgi:hypothetical protein
VSTLAPAAPAPAGRRPLRAVRPRGLGWLVWRQNRVACAVLALGTALLVTLLLHDRSTVGDLDARFKALGCGTAFPPACTTVVQQQMAVQSDWHTAMLALMVLPALLGVLLAAQPLAGDLEHGRHSMLWTQSVSPRRWLTHRLVWPALALALVGTALSLTAGWCWDWSNPPLTLDSWDQGTASQTIAPVYPALMLTAFALGAAVCLLVRRTIPAVAATLGLYGGLLFVIYELYPYLLPTQTVIHHGGDDLPDTDWIIRDGAVEAGRLIPYSQCGPSNCAAGNLTFETFHPMSDFWPMELIETGVLLAVAAGLAALAYWALRRLTR